MRNLDSGDTGRFKRVDLEALVELSRPARPLLVYRWVLAGVVLGVIVVAALRLL